MLKKSKCVLIALVAIGCTTKAPNRGCSSFPEAAGPSRSYGPEAAASPAKSSSSEEIYDKELYREGFPFLFGSESTGQPSGHQASSSSSSNEVPNGAFFSFHSWDCSKSKHHPCPKPESYSPTELRPKGYSSSADQPSNKAPNGAFFSSHSWEDYPEPKDESWIKDLEMETRKSIEEKSINMSIEIGIMPPAGSIRDEWLSDVAAELTKAVDKARISLMNENYLIQFFPGKAIIRLIPAGGSTIEAEEVINVNENGLIEIGTNAPDIGLNDFLTLKQDDPTSINPYLFKRILLDRFDLDTSLVHCLKEEGLHQIFASVFKDLEQKRLYVENFLENIFFENSLFYYGGFDKALAGNHTVALPNNSKEFQDIINRLLLLKVSVSGLNNAEVTEKLENLESDEFYGFHYQDAAYLPWGPDQLSTLDKLERYVTYSVMEKFLDELKKLRGRAHKLFNQKQKHISIVLCDILEEFNKQFDIYQNLPSHKPEGTYRYSDVINIKDTEDSVDLPVSKILSARKEFFKTENDYSKRINSLLDHAEAQLSADKAITDDLRNRLADLSFRSPFFRPSENPLGYKKIQINDLKKNIERLIGSDPVEASEQIGGLEKIYKRTDSSASSSTAAPAASTAAPAASTAAPTASTAAPAAAPSGPATSAASSSASSSSSTTPAAASAAAAAPAVTIQSLNDLPTIQIPYSPLDPKESRRMSTHGAKSGIRNLQGKKFVIVSGLEGWACENATKALRALEENHFGWRSGKMSFTSLQIIIEELGKSGLTGRFKLVDNAQAQIHNKYEIIVDGIIGGGSGEKYIKVYTNKGESIFDYRTGDKVKA